jgi:hypothetical protein
MNRDTFDTIIAYGCTLVAIAAWASAIASLMEIFK